MTDILLSLAKVLAVTYILVCALLFVFQEKMIFIGGKGESWLYELLSRSGVTFVPRPPDDVVAASILSAAIAASWAAFDAAEAADDAEEEADKAEAARDGWDDNTVPAVLLY